MSRILLVGKVVLALGLSLALIGAGPAAEDGNAAVPDRAAGALGVAQRFFDAWIDKQPATAAALADTPFMADSDVLADGRDLAKAMASMAKHIVGRKELANTPLEFSVVEDRLDVRQGVLVDRVIVKVVIDDQILYFSVRPGAQPRVIGFFESDPRKLDIERVRIEEAVRRAAGSEPLPARGNP